MEPADKHITELRGSNHAYLELNDGTQLVRFVFKSVLLERPTEETAREAVDNFLETIRALLPDGSFIIWRIEPEVKKTGHKWAGYLRFETSPPLLPEFWQGLSPDGHIPHRYYA